MELCVIETKVRGLISKEDGQLHRQVPQDIFSTCSLKIKGLREDIAAGGCGGDTKDVDRISDSDWICPDKECGNEILPEEPAAIDVAGRKHLRLR